MVLHFFSYRKIGWLNGYTLLLFGKDVCLYPVSLQCVWTQIKEEVAKRLTDALLIDFQKAIGLPRIHLMGYGRDLSLIAGHVE